jgi:hypothetical protein
LKYKTVLRRGIFLQDILNNFLDNLDSIFEFFNINVYIHNKFYSN